jgi:hypothetical protein
MASILLYSASFTQAGTSSPVVIDGSGGKGLISGSWSRLDTGSYKFTRGSGLYFTPISGSSSSSSLYGMLGIIATDVTTGSFNLFISGSDSSSLYLNTFSSDNSSRLIDNVYSGSAKAFNLSVNILY